MTIGKKLTLAFSAMLAVLLCLAGSALWSVGSMGSELDTAVNKTARKIEIAGEIEVAVLEMRSSQQGLIMFSILNDAPKANTARETFRAASGRLEKSLTNIRPLVVTTAGQKEEEIIQAQLGTWVPIYQEIDRACAAQQFDTTLTGPLERTVNMAGQMQAAADGLLAQQRGLNETATQEAKNVTTHARWNAFLLIGLGLAVGGVVFWVVRDVNAGVRNLASELGGGAEQVASGAAQVASSSQGLAQGSSEQAASLEETSASSEEINSMARKNTENSRAAAELMTRSQERFVAANQALEQTVVAMGEIHTQSGKISKIIKVIDEIAFQTNILALNAAVEAARAGEAGMGFAVVADEVRSLAQRCAQAAKDTAELIEESVAKSKDGKSKVDQVAVAIHAITEESAKVKTLIDEVNVGSQEQSRGFEQIGKALTQMEQVTQTTAASAEESASAAEELTAQSETLRDLVGRLTALVNTEGAVSRPASGGGKVAARRRPAEIAGRQTRSASSLPALRVAVASKAGSAAVAAPVGAKADKSAFPMEDEFQEF